MSYYKYDEGRRPQRPGGGREGSFYRRSSPDYGPYRRSSPDYGPYRRLSPDRRPNRRSSPDYGPYQRRASPTYEPYRREQASSSREPRDFYRPASGDSGYRRSSSDHRDYRSRPPPSSGGYRSRGRGRSQPSRPPQDESRSRRRSVSSSSSSSSDNADKSRRRRLPTVLTLMEEKYTKEGPLQILSCSMKENKKVKVWLRTYKEVSVVCTGYVKAFDKHWNMALKDADQLTIKRKKQKIPFFDTISQEIGDADTEENIKEKIKEQISRIETNLAPPETTIEGTNMLVYLQHATKAKNWKKTMEITPSHHNSVFVRGDNVVLVSLL